MPHIDELLGVATVVSVALFAAITLQAAGSGTASDMLARDEASVAIAAARSAIVRLPSVEVIARRGDEKAAPECLAKDATQPGA